jgi:predicted amino acid racemase
MFLDVTIRRNPQLIQAAIALHQAGDIPANTYLIDFDALFGNARVVTEAAERRGLRLYGMTKQHGRNPLLARAMVEAGVRKAVTVDFDEARLLRAYGTPIGHLGHLTQIPDGDIPAAVAMEPEVMTVFSTDKAMRTSEAAVRAGRVQPLLLRVVGAGDAFYPAQEGGFSIDELASAARHIARLPGVRIEGVTSFPCFYFDYERLETLASPNASSVLEAADILRETLGEPVAQINAPGMTTSGTLDLLVRMGATHGEPGSCLIGETPLHSASDQPELPAMVYVTEVSHRSQDRVFVFGGGFYPRGRTRAAIVSRTPETALSQRLLPAKPRDSENIDYYGELEGFAADGSQVGDTVVFAFRSQVFVTRSYVGVVCGVQQRRPRLLGLFDNRGNPLDSVSRLPLGRDEAAEVLEEAWRTATADPKPAFTRP